MMMMCAVFVVVVHLRGVGRLVRVNSHVIKAFFFFLQKQPERYTDTDRRGGQNLDW